MVDELDIERPEHIADVVVRPQGFRRQRHGQPPDGFRMSCASRTIRSGSREIARPAASGLATCHGFNLC
jgi:hypothetical protein